MSSSRRRSNSCTPPRCCTMTWSTRVRCVAAALRPACCGATKRACWSAISWSARLGKNVGDDFRDGKITLPVVLSFRRGSDSERVFWRRTLEDGDATENDLETAVSLMNKHRALEDTVKRARHYGSIAKDALALFPDSPMKAALAETVEFCIARAH